jgi:hypothetical protein
MYRFCRALSVFAVLVTPAASVWAGALPATLTPGAKYAAIASDNHGEARVYDVYVGKSWSATGPKAPIIFDDLLGQTAGLQQEVDTRGYLWVTPYPVPPDDRFLFYVNEYPGTYGELQHTPSQVTVTTKGDDWGYFGAVIDELAARANGDQTRVFFTGLSAGGLLTYNTAGHMAHRWRGPSSGTTSRRSSRSYRPTPIVPFRSSIFTAIRTSRWPMAVSSEPT